MVIGKQSFDSIKSSKISNKESFSIQEFRGVKKINHNGHQYKDKAVKRSLKTEDIDPKEVYQFINKVKRSVKKHIKNMDFKIEEVEKISQSTRYFNHKVYDSMADGECFISFDLDNAYWQIMRRQGVISEDLYLEFRHKRKFRQLKQAVIGLILANVKVTYYQDGEFLNSVEEDNWQWKMIYKNVRYATYNVPLLLAKACNGEFISYNQDAIYVKDDKESVVTKYLKDNGFEFKKSLCVKVNDYKFNDAAKTVKVPAAPTKQTII